MSGCLMSGIAILKKVIRENAAAPVIVMTAYGTIDDAVEAMRQGAFDYITKPFSIDELLIAVGGPSRATGSPRKTSVSSRKFRRFSAIRASSAKARPCNGC
jgi:DNA-binding NtrC family response regulator